MTATPEQAPAPRVVVLDHGSGNVRSVVRALEAAGGEVAAGQVHAERLGA
ncbi:MAG: imidazole glycerol phosphate synthase subunit HisH, partial [Brachybacterium sp.]|nr:imidazole glycerol phosphate synthase subunit HisH [Brachybacterium sp.]